MYFTSILSFVLLILISPSYAAVIEVNTLIKCVSGTSIFDTTREINSIVHANDAKESDGKDTLHIKDYTASAPSIAYDHYNYPTICVTLTRLQ